MLRVYETFARDWLALPVFTGEKSAGERFPGAVQTLCIEAMVQDRKAIQAGTSHFLGQNFAKASGIQFLSRENKQELAWTHELGRKHPPHRHRDHGPRGRRRRDPPAPRRPRPHRDLPRRPEAQRCATLFIQPLSSSPPASAAQTFHGEPLRIEIDKRDIGGGQKNWEWIKKGVPIRVELGSQRDIEKGSIAVARRDKGPKEKEFPAQADFIAQAAAILQSIQDTLLARGHATARRPHREDRLEGGILILLHPEERRETRNPRRLRLLPLVRFARVRSEDQGKS